MRSADQDKGKSLARPMYRGEQRKMKWAKLSGPRRKLPPREGFQSLHHLQSKLPSRKQKYSAVDSFQVLPCRPLTDTHLLHSGQHNRTTAIPIQVSPALASCAKRGMAFVKFSVLRKHPLGTFQVISSNPTGLQIHLPCLWRPQIYI